MDLLHYPDNQSSSLVPKSCHVTILPTMIGDVNSILTIFQEEIEMEYLKKIN